MFQNKRGRNYRLEYRLKDYAPLLLYIQSILLFRRPFEAVMIVVGTHLIWWYVVAELSYATVIALFLTTYTVGGWFLDTVSVNIPWEQWLKYENARHYDYYYNEDYYNYDGSQFHDVSSLTYSHLFSEINAISETTRRMWIGFQIVRQKNIHKFTLYITLMLLMVAYIGSFASGFFLAYMTAFSLLLFPSIYRYRVPYKIYEFFVPIISDAKGIISGVHEETEREELFLAPNERDCQISDHESYQPGDDETPTGVISHDTSSEDSNFDISGDMDDDITLSDHENFGEDL